MHKIVCRIIFYTLFSIKPPSLPPPLPPSSSQYCLFRFDGLSSTKNFNIENCMHQRNVCVYSIQKHGTYQMWYSPVLSLSFPLFLFCMLKVVLCTTAAARCKSSLAICDGCVRVRVWVSSTRNFAQNNIQIWNKNINSCQLHNSYHYIINFRQESLLLLHLHARYRCSPLSLSPVSVCVCAFHSLARL